MNLTLIFRLEAAILFINGFLLIFFTTPFLEMAAFNMTPELVTLGQVFGCAVISLGIIAFRTPDISENSMKQYGQLYSIICVIFFLMIGYHIFTGQASGPTPVANLAINLVFGGLFFIFSKD